MATNPRIPPRQERPGDRPQIVIAEKRNNWWPPVLVIIVLAIIGALIWWLSQSPNRKGAPNAVSSSVNGVNVELRNLSATNPTTTGAFDVSATLVNNGNAPITGVKVEAAFKNIQGQTLETIPGDVLPAQAVKNPPPGVPAGSSTADTKAGANPAQTHGFVKPGGGEGNLTQSPNRQNPPMQPGFVKNPVQPGQSVPIIIQFTHVPTGWVGGVPELRITGVDTGQQSGAAANAPGGGSTR